MTECERIVKEGIVPEEFLKEETKCDFFVDSTRKKIWAIELDLLRVFDSFCHKYRLNYFLGYGTLIGAARHKGFIPWDDDVDVAMMRKDYETLLKHSKEFESPYFFQTPYTDPNYAFSFAKLVNDNTTYCSEMFSYQGYHAGICIDIFPWDNCVLEKSREIYDRIKYLNMENSTFMRMKNPHLNAENQMRVKKWSGINPLSAYEEIQQLASQFNDIDTSHIALAVSTIGKYGKAIYPRDIFNETTYLDFEQLKLPVPAGYDRLLRIMYGNYEEFPPVETRGKWHKDLIVDPDTPYTIRLKHT